MKIVNIILNHINKYFYKNKILFDEIFEYHKFVMLIIDPKTGYIINANQKALLFYGYSKEEFYKMKIQDINILDHNQVNEEMRKAKEEKRNFLYFSLKLANREIRDVEV
ncbi:PAS domain-containing protein [Clostridium sp. DL1XJH146]